MNISEHLPISIVLFQLIVGVMLPLFHKWKESFTSIIVAFAAIINVLISSASILQILKSGTRTYQLGGWASHLGIEVVFDNITALTSLLISVIFMIIIFYAIKGIEEEIDSKQVGHYFSLFFFLNAAMYGMAMAFDIFNLYVFMEISLIASVGIVTIKDTPEAIQGGFKYLILNAIGSSTILLGIGMIYQTTGYLNFIWIAQEINSAWANSPQVITAVIGLFIVGFSLKSALFPLHIWLPDAHSAAPTPSSAMLSGLIIKVYCISLIRIIYIVLSPQVLEAIPLGSILRILAAISILFGSFFAILQTDIKRMLAYSSVSQIGYIVLGFSLFTQSGLQGSLLHVINHAFMKSGLFLAAGNIIKKTGIKKINRLSGLGRKMPVTFTAFSLGALAMIGIPPLNGFFSKWYLALGSLEANMPIYLVVIIVSSLLNATYYLPVIVKGFFYESQENLDGFKEVKPSLYIPPILLGSSCLVLGLGIKWPMKIIDQVAKTLLTMGG
ncbi:complex I subunit 5 family protein [Acetohalobium arabaticum]|uniref:Multisubunit sodium/proton antiporter, MrpD subunit (2.A.63.1) n=1 Tax=Acetohalobium arabaticum (strain ATCC 49924 / DSM 5501 / Z-7288) TaxID=574087 RepID=D9QQ29_ACEAZ|nr:proton-conducting transporter membrane subunit [Acetohalobium arabaticum]ADL12620.1 multisubunit sodium/proton antiporter, MrpD subunit (2.A.63.1) [Acetohalobium arabaticum DSM 5501]